MAQARVLKLVMCQQLRFSLVLTAVQKRMVTQFSCLLLQLRLHRSPLWRDLATARQPSADLPAEEDSASDATGSAERAQVCAPGASGDC